MKHYFTNNRNLCFLLSVVLFGIACVLFMSTDGSLFSYSSLRILSYKQLGFMTILLTLTVCSLYYVYNLFVLEYSRTILDYTLAALMVGFTIMVFKVFLPWNSYMLLSHVYLSNYLELSALGIDFSGFWQCLMDGKEMGISAGDLKGQIAAIFEKDGKVFACLDVKKGIDVAANDNVEYYGMKGAQTYKKVPDIVCSELTDLVRGAVESSKK